MKTTNITLGGQSYMIEELPARKNAAWRTDLSTHLQPVLDLIEQAGAGAELRTNEDLLRVVNSVLPVIWQSPEMLHTLVCAYAPQLADALADAYDSEIADAFTSVLGLAFPFGGLVRLARSVSGSPATTKAPISMNSPSPNGVSHSPTTLTKSGG